MHFVKRVFLGKCHHKKPLKRGFDVVLTFLQRVFDRVAWPESGIW